MSKDEFFVGYLPTSKSDRRFFLTAGLGLMIGTAGLATGLAALQTPPGPGNWDQGRIAEFTGVVTATPYPMLRLLNENGTAETALLACLGKCGVSVRLGNLAGQAVTVKGSVIQRGRHKMIAVIDGDDWIMPADSTPDPQLSFPAPLPLEQISLQGEILDSKCWFGAMRPSEGKVHKSCASLCIRGGIPPAFYVSDGTSQALLIMTNNGLAHDEDLLEYVAAPVSISGQAMRMGDILLLDAPVSAITRI